jgi:hypothetical protein
VRNDGTPPKESTYGGWSLRRLPLCWREGRTFCGRVEQIGYSPAL